MVTQALIFTAFWMVAILCLQLPSHGHGLSIINNKPMTLDPSRSDYYIVELVRQNKHLYWLVRSAYMLPALLAMSIYYHKPLVFVIGLLIELQGSLYWLAGKLVPEKHAVRVGEGLTAILIGVMVTLSAMAIKGDSWNNLPYTDHPIIDDELDRLS